MYSGHVEGAFGLFGNSIITGNITVNFSGSNCDPNPVLRMNYFLTVSISPCVADELFSNCDTKESVDVGF